MKVPLAVTSLDEGLLIYYDGKMEKVPYPFKPFLYVQKDKITIDNAPIVTLTKVPENENREYYKLEFENSRLMFDFRERHKDLQRYILIFSYLKQLITYNEDFLLQYPHTKDLSVLFWDIEVASRGDGLWPMPIISPILSIGYSIWSYQGLNKAKIAHEVLWGYNNQTQDKPILKEFIDRIQKHNPDVIAGFNTDLFDFPYFIERCQINGIQPRIGRGMKEVVIEEGKVTIPGRINFDIYNSSVGVIKDQTLFGLKNRSLKTLGHYYKAPVTTEEVPKHMENLLELFNTDPAQLYSYQSDDIIRTEHVGNIYIRNCIALAELIKAPLNNIINMMPSFIPTMMMLRNNNKEGIINTETNFSRYNKEMGSIAKLGTKYEGAIVKIYKDGFFKKIDKIDFSGQYSSAIQTWNIGADTTSLQEILPYTGKYKFNNDSKFNWYRIPDENFKVDLLIKVRRDKESYLKKEITKLKALRIELKKYAKICPKEETEIVYSQQWAVKVLLNSVSGTLGEKSSTVGDVISAALVTGICRWLTLKVATRIPNLLVEIDTDGIIIDSPIDINETNTWIDNLIKTKFNLSENYMSMEYESFGKAFFYAMKTYILENEEGGYDVHGSSLLSSRSCNLIDKAIELSIQNIFNNKPEEEVIRELYNFKLYKLEDFEERVKLSKDPIEYNNQEFQGLYLSEQVRLKTGLIPTKGMQIDYLVTKKPLPFKELQRFNRKTAGWNYTFSKYVTTVDELNLDYYTEKLDKTLAKFGIRNSPQLELDFGGPKKRVLSRETPLDKLPEDPEGV